ncbi:hypothetical protein FH972_022575 [Carpinus fangiana]|uniref:CoA carboxyltransferase C-terminal domain-containing protein n=1 Tax=Carpinus fangiana TaxID=176857 RepID=A0A5N6KT74_9ROSI|nr:hypothetical protein FH972_022575 [Carpinus fangiana]
MANDDDPSNKAQVRLDQISSHLKDGSGESNASGSRRKSRRKGPDDTLPADYSDILAQLSRLRTIAATPPTQTRGYQRQKKAGKLWVRERVHQLLDTGSFQEVGSVTGNVDWRSKLPLASSNEDGEPSKEEWDGISEEIAGFVPSNSVQGFGKLRGRRIVFTADDYSIRAGHADGAMMSKTIYMENLSLSLRIPMIKLVDGSSGGGSVTTIATQGFSYIPPLPSIDVAVKAINAGIPNLGAVLGPAIGLGAARVTMCHFSVMTATVSSLFNAGPAVVAGATFEEGLTLKELGGPDMHARNGTIDNLAADEKGAFEQLRTVLSYLPNCGSTAVPPIFPVTDPASRQETKLRSIIPRRKARTYSPHAIIAAVADKGSFFEIGALWGNTVIVGLARLAGKPIGIAANSPNANSGALDAAGSQKLSRHIKFCDVFNLPLLQFVDVPGYAVGTVAERSATMRHGVALAMAYYTSTMPVFSVVVRRVYGVAGGVMLDCREPRMRVAWPSGDWGSLPLDGGIEVGHSAELQEAATRAAKQARTEAEAAEEAGADAFADGKNIDERAKEAGENARKELYEKLRKDYTRLMNPVRTANAFGVEEIIDPAVTRPVVCQWVDHVYEELLPVRVQERIAGKIHPQFAYEAVEMARSITRSSQGEIEESGGDDPWQQSQTSTSSPCPAADRAKCSTAHPLRQYQGLPPPTKSLPQDITNAMTVDTGTSRNAVHGFHSSQCGPKRRSS